MTHSENAIVEKLTAKIDNIQSYQELKHAQQDEFNKSFIQSLERVNDAISNIAVYTERVNVLNTQTEQVNGRVFTLEDRVAKLHTNISVSNEITKELKSWKKVLCGVFITAIAGAVAATIIPDQKTQAMKEQNKTMQDLIQTLRESKN